MSACALCPRRCGADRAAGKSGFCGVPALPMVCRAAPHFGEEPCISGTRGSGAVFFAGCNLRCVFCQNRAISRGEAGETLTAAQLRDTFLRLRDQGVHNLNLVTPTHYADVIAEVLAGLSLGIPVVWNSSGYESAETLRMLDGLVQIYMPDYKYADAALAARYSAAPDYPETALTALREMFRQVGPFELDGDGILRRGLLIRHLILPGAAENTLRCIDRIEDNFPPREILFSLMSQYTPMPGLEAFPELQRPITAAEFERCRSYLDFSEIEYGYWQSPEAATDEMIPEFDGTGVSRKGPEGREAMKLYEASLSDETAEILIALSRDWEAEGNCHGYRANDRSDLEGSRVFLAEEDGAVVGYLFGHSYRAKTGSSVMAQDTPCFEVEELYVVPARRSCGAGRALFRFAQAAVSPGADFITLSTATKNWRAILHFYIDELGLDFWDARLFLKTR